VLAEHSSAGGRPNAKDSVRTGPDATSAAFPRPLDMLAVSCGSKRNKVHDCNEVGECANMRKYDDLVPAVNEWAKNWDAYKWECTKIICRIFRGFIDKCGFPPEHVLFVKLNKQIRPTGESWQVAHRIPELVYHEGFLVTGVRLTIGEFEMGKGFGHFDKSYGFRKTEDRLIIKLSDRNLRFDKPVDGWDTPKEDWAPLYDHILDDIARACAKPVIDSESPDDYVSPDDSEFLSMQ
jgi:hypothetical protein